MADATQTPPLSGRGRLFRRNIESLIMSDGLTYQQAASRLEADLDEWNAGSEERAALSEAVASIRADHERVQYLTECALRAGRVAWYSGPTGDAQEWNALTARLRSVGRAQEEIDLVDRESTTVLSLLDNPGLKAFKTKGLVVGHVQSGKTGNMAALLAKAAGTPYKFFVVLSGLTNALRNQTQKRLDADIIDPAIPGRWHRHTRADIRHSDGTVFFGDFRLPVGGFQLGGSTRHLAVMKKNAAVLRRFRDAIKATPRAMLESTPFLIIDDECDQASVNSAAYDRAVTAINGLLREIIESLPRVAYVGYTATPYANVLINTQDTVDLYPRDFIHALERPAAYFGAEELFGRSALEGEAEPEDLEGYAMIRAVRDEEIALLRPVSRSGAFRFEVSPSMEQAIRYFVMAIAAREERGIGDGHATMLVHTSMLNRVHLSTYDALKPYLEHLREQLARGDRVVLDEMHALWEEESALVPASEFGREPISFDRLVPRLGPVAKSIDIKIENFLSTDRIDYDEPGRRYLVIGGNVLARGLTLEGLMVSLFMRTSSQYDTLMQMGRWFGYRPGFEDLPRIWMEDSVKEAFFRLSAVEAEIRRDIEVYAKENLTPLQFPVRIRRIPGLMATNRARMRYAVTAQIGYAGSHVQTIRFPRNDVQWLRDNWAAGGRLLAASNRVRSERNVFSTDLAAVVGFLSSYQVRGNSSGLDTGLIANYLRQSVEKNPSLQRWNVVVVTAKGGVPARQPLGPLDDIPCVNRSAMRGDQTEAFIKALMSKHDLLLDMEERPMLPKKPTWSDYKNARAARNMPPLLLLYPIDRASRPQEGARDRVNLEALHDVLGLGIVFPGDPLRSHDYISADLQPLDSDDVEGVDEAMESMIRAMTEDEDGADAAVATGAGAA